VKHGPLRELRVGVERGRYFLPNQGRDDKMEFLIGKRTTALQARYSFFLNLRENMQGPCTSVAKLVFQPARTIPVSIYGTIPKSLSYSVQRHNIRVGGEWYLEIQTTLAPC
jgi:hypothetical protein